jgi:hypothetical protein
MNKKNSIKREAILALLSETELAKVSTAEGAQQLIEGDVYVDLTHLDAGIQQVKATPRTPPGHALPRYAVSDATWEKIVRAVAD